MLSRRHSLVAGLALLLGGCGFRLRGSNLVMPFKHVRLDAADTSTVVTNLTAQLQATGVQVTRNASQPSAPGVGAPAGAAIAVPDAILQVLQDQRERTVVGTTTTGQVRELQLRQRFRFSVRTPAGRELMPATEVLQERDLSFSETQVLGKEMEEALLYQDMQAAVVRQVMYRLAALKGL